MPDNNSDFSVRQIKEHSYCERSHLSVNIMDIVERENVNVSNAVIVGGITLRESDQNLEVWLMRFGSISRTLLIDDPTSESVYGSVEDGEELLAKFMTMLQNQGEKPSSYLHRLQVMLSTAVRRGVIAESERDRCLLNQFCRGCWDNGLIANLQLERRKINPP